MMEFFTRFFIGILIGIFVTINVDSVGNKANLPDLPLDGDSLEYLVDEKTKEHLKKLYHDQVEDVLCFRDKIKQYKQKEWVSMLVSIVNENGILFDSLLEPICGINAKVVSYTKALANKGIVNGFDSNVHKDIESIFKFANQYHIVVEETFLYASQNIANTLEQYKQIGKLDTDQLFLLEASMETLRNVVDDNVAFANGAVKKLQQTMKGFVESTKKLANILHKLQLIFQNSCQSNVEQQRNKVLAELKQQIVLCLKETTKKDVQNNIQQNIVGIKEEMQYADNSLKSLFKDIEDVILKRELESPIASPGVQQLQESNQNIPQMTLDLPVPNLKLLTINTKKSKVKELIDYFNQYTNIVTPRQLVNSAKTDVTLRDLLKKDKINISLDEKQLVKAKIHEFETCKIPKIPKGKKTAASSSKKPPKK